ncbi:sigma-54 dependent transcriptional regulator [Marinobacter sp. 2_MG-2023]|uniref:sigma-54-dependent transcriptional regulator n=1 Tax=Marinobacter sp. 2_MG-2023 TaxID=3062679 RepID=UPI0026E41FD9|nr:sigma-54 dependent transcriptional regulator [Marinobacter sp. 2_MG-2023]MDO6442288.1 sigma-54 dependent transcriptional regulator [Marinobacter sp. 2_MG-2023]
MDKALILIIDDEQRLVRSLQLALETDGYRIAAAHTGNEGIETALDCQPDLVLLDLRLPDLSGLEVLKQLQLQLAGCPVVMFSAHGDIKVAIEAVKSGALDFITKPFDIHELKSLIARTLERCRLDKEVRFFRERQLGEVRLIGRSEAMRRLHEDLTRIARSGAKTLLLQGASGTGKTAVAREIHQLSKVASGPFVEVNCAALPEHLLEAELFGAEKGAYTGAHQRRSGLVELANGGTLFLDEIGEMPLALQAKLLSFLEDHSYRPIGSSRVYQAEARIVAATNRELGQAAEEGSFRADLYYRLNVMPIRVPALVERRDDIPLLIEHFSLKMAASEGCSPVLFEPEVLEHLKGYVWPGNIRELKNLLERLTVLYPGEVVTLHMLPPEMQLIDAPEPSADPSDASISDRLAETERDIIIRTLEQAGGRKGVAAVKLGISRHALKRRLQKLGIAE